MFIKYHTGNSALVFVDTEFQEAHSLHYYIFDNFIAIYKRRGQDNIENIFLFLRFYSKFMYAEEFNLKIHQYLLDECVYYKNYADRILKYMLWI